MCGIYGIVGKTTTTELLNKLELLEYRGYDSCGIAYLFKNRLFINKSIGNINKLRKEVYNHNIEMAIGHTRWATHGIVNTVNAHPHTSDKKRFYVVHNGMIDNYKEIIEKYKINTKTETDTEIIPYLLDYLTEKNRVVDALHELQRIIVGSYAIVVFDRLNNDCIYFLKNKSPLLLAINKASVVLSSDQIAFEDESNVTILNDYDYGYINKGSYRIFSNKVNERWNTFYKNDSYIINKKTEHYMLDEILYQDKMIEIITSNYNKININTFNDLLDKNKEIVFVGAGSSYYASMILSSYYERKLKKRCYAIIASEIMSFNILYENTLFIFLSQSGETADLCIALNILKQKKYEVISLCNNVNSTLGYNSDYIFPLFAKKEISVASTKALTSMIYVGRLLINKTMLDESYKLINDIRKVFEKRNDIMLVGQKIAISNCIFFIGKNIDYPIALEASLKLREISYIHSFAFPAGELKHGSIALIDNKSSAIAIVSKKEDINLVKNNLEEVKSRGGNVYLLSNCYKDADFYIEGDIICLIIFLQLLAYYTALSLKRNIDQPRNLAKSVTVL
ncbi:MAG: glutamine--fructose-6-phosphate transaminase (isomerizing) [Anaeroplasma sp.]